MKMNFFKDGKLSGKGAATVICFCLAAVAAMGIFSYNKAAKELTGELSGVVENTSETAPANIEAENIPMTEAQAPAENVVLERDAFGGDEESTQTEEPQQSETQSTAQESDTLSDAVVRPVNGDILNEFSDGELVKSRTLNVWKTHDGIDIAADAGTDVKSMTSGTVESVTQDPLMGVTVIIDHGSGYEGYYCNLSEQTAVMEGDTVSAGTVIGTVGATAEAEISEEPHLHFGLMKNGSWTDPADILSGEGS